MGGTFKNRRTLKLQAQAAKLEAKGKKMVADGRALLVKARSLRAEANRASGAPKGEYRPSAALRSALGNSRKLRSKSDYEKAFRKRLGDVDGNVTVLATKMGTHRVQIRRWAEALGISMDSYR